MRNIIATIVFLAACGDNISPPDARERTPYVPPIGPIDPGPSRCPDFDTADCPKTPEDPTTDAGNDGSGSDVDDGSGSDVDAGSGSDSTELKASCCRALVDGTPPNIECGYPPGICHSGRHDLFCGDLTFQLCNP